MTGSEALLVLLGEQHFAAGAARRAALRCPAALMDFLA